MPHAATVATEHGRDVGRKRLWWSTVSGPLATGLGGHGLGRIVLICLFFESFQPGLYRRMVKHGKITEKPW